MIHRDSFIFYRSFAEAIDELPDRDQLKVYRAIKDYALDGAEDGLSGVAKSFLHLIKPQIDANNRRFEKGKSASEHGAKGGRPKKEKAAGAEFENPKETPNAEFENPNETPNREFENPKETPNAEFGNPNETPNREFENPKETPNVDVDVDVNVNENVVSRGASKKPPPTKKTEGISAAEIQKLSAKTNFGIDFNLAERIRKTSPPEWLGEFTIFEFISGEIRARYPQKTVPELKKLYADIFWRSNGSEKYADILSKFEEWRRGREKERERAEKKAIYDRARRKKPTRCECGGAIFGERCAKCGAFLEFDEENLIWTRHEAATGESFGDEFRKFYAAKAAEG